MSLLERVRAVGPEAGLGGSEARDLREARRGLKAALVERLGLAVIAGMLSWEDPRRARDELGVALDAILNTQDFGSLGPDERSLLSRQILDVLLARKSRGGPWTGCLSKASAGRPNHYSCVVRPPST